MLSSFCQCPASWPDRSESELRWTERQGAQRIQQNVRELVGDEPDPRVRIWARVRLGGERLVDAAKELGYRDGTGVLQVVKRMERRGTKSKPLAQKLQSLRNSVAG